MVAPAPTADPAAPPAPAAAPAVVEPAAAPAAKPGDSEAPAVDPNAIPEAEPSLLELAQADGSLKGDKKPGEKAEDKKPGDEQSKPAAAPAYEFKPYNLPEGLQADEAMIGTFNKTLIDPALDPQTRGQALLEMHRDVMSNYSKFVEREQHRHFADTRRAWIDEIKRDPQLGGPAFKTTVESIARVRDKFVSEKNMPAFNAFLKITGAGENPEFARFLVAIDQKFREPSPPPPGGRPPSDIGIKPRSQGGKRESMYDHPNSERARNKQGR